MDALILSCGTGGGHNAAGRALQEALERRGDRAVFMNPYSLRGQHIVDRVDKVYIAVAQRFPKLFGAVYKLGDLYRHLPWRSPVYYFNRKAARALGDFLKENSFDVILLTHLYPGEMLTVLKDRGMEVPPVLFVSTDYTCIPFTEEVKLDACVIPHPDLADEFASYGISRDKLHPLGIPVSAAFRQDVSRQEARADLGLDQSETYLLVSAGIMGAGVLKKEVKKLLAQWEGKANLIVICGTNDRLYRALEKKYGERVDLLHSTNQMPLYLRACDLYLTKPGGLSSTEAAVAGLPLVHLSPIPGCETRNARFFAQRGLSIPADQAQQAGALAPDVIRRQSEVISPTAAEDICELAHSMAEARVC